MTKTDRISVRRPAGVHVPAFAFFATCLSLITAVFMNATAQSIPLPSPDLKGTVPLEQALAGRKSIRSFDGRQLELKDLSQLLWAAQGRTQGNAQGSARRTAPSAGATYPLEVYACVKSVRGLKPGLYRYLSEAHALEPVREGDFSRPLCEAAWNQRSVESAPLNVVIAAVFSRTEKRYKERAERYVFMEAGHAGQNLYLEATALGLGTVAIGAFDDERMQSVLGIPEKVLYLYPAGFPPP
jgi:SagB-type dehydrogenase family enzyme